MKSQDPASVVFQNKDPASSMVTASPLYGLVIYESGYTDLSIDWSLLTILLLRSVQTQCTRKINVEQLFERVDIAFYRTKQTIHFIVDDGETIHLV